MNYEKQMLLAIEVAKQNPDAPFGTVLVDCDNDEVKATGVNQASLNPILHGEIVAINNYAATGANKWGSLALFTTAEPCCMCQSAIIWAGISTVVYGTSVKTLTELGWRQFSLSAQNIIDSAPFSKCQLAGGVLQKQCDELFNVKGQNNE